MEHLDSIMGAITSVGFPIVMSLVLFWYVTRQAELHKEEILELKNVLSANNEVLASLKQLIEDKLQ